MIRRLKALLEGSAEKAAHHSHDELRLAAAVLLVEAAALDEEFDDAEEEVIRTLLKDRFSLEPSEVETLIAEARDAQHHSVEMATFTRTIKDHFSEEERVEMMEMLWEVAYADGVVHDYEAHLLRRIAGLLYVSDKNRGAARKRVAKRLGIDERSGHEE